MILVAKMSTKMEVDIPQKDHGDDSCNIAIHPLAVVHMSDQFTRISCGGSPLEKDAPVVGLLFGNKDNGVLQIQDADDIPTDTLDTTTLQVELHRAVFPQHSVVGWYRVALDDEQPSPSDLQTTKSLKEHYAPSLPFCFCLLQVHQQKNDSPTDTMNKDLPINLFELHKEDQRHFLFGLSDWKLETSEPERIAVERVMKERPLEAQDGTAQTVYVSNSKSIQLSLDSMKERVQVLISFLQQTEQGEIPPNHSLLRKVQSLVYSLAPLGEIVGEVGIGDGQDAELLSHLAAVSKTVSAVQAYTDKFRLVHESRTVAKEMRRTF